MAGIHDIDVGEDYIQWEIYGLSNYAKDYDEFMIDLYQDETYLNTFYWTSSNPDFNTWHTTGGLSSGTTYTAYGYAKWAGVWYSVGSDSATTTSSRPPYFSWTFPKVSGGNFNLTASEWNEFTDNINQVRNYVGLGDYNFTTAYSGNPFTATMFNQAREAIGDMNSDALSLPYKYSGDDIYAYFLDDLVYYLNQV